MAKHSIFEHFGDSQPYFLALQAGVLALLMTGDSDSLPYPPRTIMAYVVLFSLTLQTNMAIIKSALDCPLFNETVDETNPNQGVRPR